MYVKKFQADTLDEALKQIKRELGPDAIILKTITNKGFKGALKKKRIEITAAISEKNYSKKAKVDSVFNPEQKEQFYSSKASSISTQIDNHSEANPNPTYGNMGLNKIVKKTTDFIKSGLDDFLSDEEAQTREESPSNQSLSMDDFLAKETDRTPTIAEHRREETTEPLRAPVNGDNVSKNALRILAEEQNSKIMDLEAKIGQLAKMVENRMVQGSHELEALRINLKSLGINEQIIQNILKKANFELSDEDQADKDIIFDFCLRELEKIIRVEMPLFSTIDDEESTITVLLSDAASGQTSILYKLGALNQDTVLLQFGHSINNKASKFVNDIYNLNVIRCHNLAEMTSECRKASDNKKNVIIDFRNLDRDQEETKKFIDGLRRSFEKRVEVLVCLSSIHSELYNRRVLAKYSSIANGVIVSHLDLCLDYGQLINLQLEHRGMSYKFFGTGPVIPEDIEGASKERLLVGLFDLLRDQDELSNDSVQIQHENRVDLTVQ